MADSQKRLPVFRKPAYKTDRDVGTKRVIDINQWVEETSRDIVNVRPGSFTPNPAADRAVIQSVFNSLKKKEGSQNSSDEFVLEKIFSAWVDLAVVGYDKFGKEVNYSEADLLNKAEKMRRLYIQTAPDKATIVIDGDPKIESNNYVWVEEGQHVLELTKDKYKPLKEPIDINSSTPSTLTKTLQRKN